MNPIENKRVSDEFHQFILQDEMINPSNKIPRFFNISPPENTDQTKKDLKKKKPSLTDLLKNEDENSKDDYDETD